VDGTVRKVRVKDKAVEKGTVTCKKADLTDSRHVASPLPGTSQLETNQKFRETCSNITNFEGVVEVMYVGVGSEVKKGDPLMLVTAMKMAVQVVAPHNGKVVEIPVKVYPLLFLPSFWCLKLGTD
jgi:pyruvate carboxylase